MILVPRWLAIVYVFLVIAALLGLGFLGYHVILDGNPGDQKSNAELIIYIAIVAATVLLFLLTFLVARTEFVSRELDKMVALNRYGDFSPEVSMRKLGKIGEKITMLYFRLNALNEKRALKISALSDLAQLLASNVVVPLLVSDVAGEILYVSKSAGEKLGKSRAEMLNASITDLVSTVSLQSVINQLDRTNRILSLKGDELLSVIPVYNRNNELSYLVWVLGREELVTDFAKKPEPQSRGNGMVGLVRRMFLRSSTRKTKE